MLDIVAKVDDNQSNHPALSANTRIGDAQGEDNEIQNGVKSNENLFSLGNNYGDEQENVDPLTFLLQRQTRDSFRRNS